MKVDEYNKFGTYTGAELMSLSIKSREFLMDKFIKERDSIIFVGEEKSGKSLCTMQMMCSLTSGQPFLDRFGLKKMRRVVSVQIEGELEDTKDRLVRMSKVIDFNPENFLLHYVGPMNLQDPQEVKPFVNKFIDFKPDIIVIDPVYFAFQGDLNDNTVVRAFTGNIRAIKNKLNCAVVLVHHTHRLRFDKMGNLINEGDEAIFGSKFFKAWADHILFFAYNKKEATRILACSTQRSVEINDSIKMRLIQPQPLYFEEIMEAPSREIVVLDAIRSVKGASINDIKEVTDLADSTVYRCLATLIANGNVEKSSTRPVQYWPVNHNP